jgi:antitoxin (DNA-binding transcriptional repressor) of toxin-antitoxin stability system
MEMQTATLRDLKNFPAIRRRVDRHEEVVIMHKGKPFYVITRLAQRPTKPKPRPKFDFWARLVAQQPKPLTAEAAKALLDYNRGDR